ncbi:MAG: hypothetical protein FJ045_02500 [Crenarchaeota archaeon]|nr:hypothetical protein [Thermoproteota archaeon]
MRTEKKNKDRAGIKKWLEFGIKTGELSDFYLDYGGKVSVLKSALQKYIRRGETEKALKAGKFLYLLAKGSAIDRLKNIVVEDVASATSVVQYLNAEIGPSQFLACVKFTADAPKDKKYAITANRLENLTERQLSQISSDTEDGLVAHLFLLGEDKNENEIYSIVGRSPVTESLVQRAIKGTYFKGDRFCLYAAALDYSQSPTPDIKLPNVRFDEIEPIKFGDIDWYCLDFHTPVGRTALNFFISKHRDIDRVEFKTAWFMGESAKLGGKVLCRFKMDYNKELWDKYKDEIKGLVEHCREREYRLQDY